MAEADYYLCDVCKEKVAQHNRILVPTGYIEVGNSAKEVKAEPVTRPSDLCPTHMAALVRDLVTTVDGYKSFNIALSQVHNEEAKCRK